MNTEFWLENFKQRHPLEPRRRREDYIKMDLQDMREGVDWIHLAQNRNK